MVMTQELSAKAREILDVLQGVDSWLDRNEIADKLGKNRLNPHEVKVLDGLVDTGQVERDAEQVGISEKYIYRIAQ